MDKPKIIVVCGPTATGKSDLAVSIAKEVGGEIISADSRQIYKDLNIGSGKITKKEMRGVPHYMLDIVSAKSTFTVAQFKKKGEKIIQDILKRGKVPIIAGGTGFYIDALVYGITYPEVKPNKELRKELEEKSLEELQVILKKKDKKRYDVIDLDNKVRLVRAIEIIDVLGKVPEPIREEKYNPIFIGLDYSDEILKKRIHDRLLKRMRNGMKKEVEDLHNSGVSWKRLESLGLEYRYLALFLQNKIPKEEMISELENKIWQFAKRQRTWFKRNKHIYWYDLSEMHTIQKRVNIFLKK